jgi:hypothetical protein
MAFSHVLNSWPIPHEHGVMIHIGIPRFCRLSNGLGETTRLSMWNLCQPGTRPAVKMELTGTCAAVLLSLPSKSFATFSSVSTASVLQVN